MKSKFKLSFSEEPLYKKCIFKEPRSQFGVSSFLREHILTNQKPQKSNLSVITYEKFFFAYHQFHLSPSKSYLTDILVHKLSLQFSIK